jgi:hypothetical protein
VHTLDLDFFWYHSQSGLWGLVGTGGRALELNIFILFIIFVVDVLFWLEISLKLWYSSQSRRPFL